MADMSERHEIRVQGTEHAFVFVADSADGRLVIRQESEGKEPREMCAITLANPEELRTFFKGFRRVLASMGQAALAGESSPPSAPARAPAALGRPGGRRAQPAEQPVDREALIEKARERNPQAFAAWTPEQEADVRRRFQAGEAIAEIARAHKRSQRAIEVRLQRLGLMAADPKDV
jgi:hypothetical protein